MSRVRTIELEVGDLRFVASSCGAPDAPLVLLLHGFPQTRHTWRHELPALANAGFHAVAPDQRGYSPGARPEGVAAYRIEHLLEDVLGFADALGAERFHLVGHDWGGHLAWTTAALHPGRVQSLAVLSRPHPASFARASASSEQRDRSKHHRSFQRAEATDELLANDCAWLRNAYARQGVPEADAEVYLETVGRRAALDAAIHWYRALPDAGLAAKDVPRIVVPTLFGWGDADATVGRPAAEGSAEFVDAAYRFEVFPGIGHFVTDQAPEAFAPLLIEHVRAQAER